ncbi:MAG: hypothetical protein IJF75_02995 [Clostridia bacterium]|nr:hypothetical protein [Clostridia bacterium]MBQ4122489.1 hypothetical protein [bacterium]
MKRIESLNTDFFKLYGDIYENRTFLSEKQKSYMQNALFAQYKIELDKILFSKNSVDVTEVFIKKERLKKQSPKKFIFYNKVARLLNKLLKDEAKDYLLKIKTNGIQD